MELLDRSKSILEDSVEVEPVLDFKRYSQSIAKLIRNSDHKFSIGIYGEWGTGKTTLMKLIEKAIRGYIFSWDKYRLYNEEGLMNS
jgi:predicted KAP-like P-loop ATPase